MASSNQRSTTDISLQDLPQLHEITKALAAALRQELNGHLDTLGPLFRPRRLLGDYLEGSGGEKAFQADQNFEKLRTAYTAVAERPFGLRSDLRPPLESIPSEVKLYSREYVHTASGGKGEPRAITMSCPFSWYLVYSSTYTPDAFAKALAGEQERDADSVRDFVLRALLLELLFSERSGLGDLLQALRFEVRFDHVKELGQLPMLVVSAPLQTVRPEDKTLLDATAISGRAAFDEVIALESVRTMPDPLKARIEAVLSEHGESLD